MWHRTTSISRWERRSARQRRRVPPPACGSTTRHRRCSSPNGLRPRRSPAPRIRLWPTGGAGQSAWAASRSAEISSPHSWSTRNCRLTPRSPSSRQSASDATTRNGAPVWKPWAGRFVRPGMSARRLSSTASTSSDREVSSVAPSQPTSNWRPVGSATALPAIWPAGSRPWYSTRVPAAFCPMPTASSGSGTWTRRCAPWPRLSPTTSATAVWRARWPRNTSMRVASWGVCSSVRWPSVSAIQRSDMNPAIDHTTELRHALERSGEPGATELLEALQALLGGAEADGPTIALTQLKRRVYRVDFGPGPGPRSFILKRSEPMIALLNRLVAERWLPAIGLGDRCAPLLATAAERQGRWVWQIYEDLGDETLDRCTERSRVESAVELVAELHIRAAGHPLLPEVRHHSKDLGLSFFMSNVADAIRGLEALPRAALQPSAKTMAIRDRLLDRLYPALTDAPRRAQVLKEAGGSVTLLYGDLWRANAFVTATGNGTRVRLIDWDHVGVGPFSYDLSTFLMRFSPAERPWLLSHYRQAVAVVGWQLPAERELNVLFETAEYARFAIRVAWAAMAWLHDGAEWVPVYDW